ncbi:unnamed protein product [Sphagnum balticum]
MRQDGMNVHRLMAEVQAMIEQHLDQQKKFEKMMIANGVLESTQISMATEIAALKLEIHNLQNERGSSQTTAEDATLETSAVVLWSSTHLSGGLVPPATFAQREIYILGGLADTWLESVIVYSLAMNQMRSAAPMLAPRSYAASLLDGNIYLYGGGDGSSWSDSGMFTCCTNPDYAAHVAECYSSTAGRWEACAPMHLKRGSLGGATVGNHIYARFCVTAVELNGAIYAFGGFDGGNYLMSVEQFDPREARWSQVPAMGCKQGSLISSYTQQEIVRENFLSCPLSVVWFHLDSYLWGKLLMAGPAYDKQTCLWRAVVLDDALYVLGGMEDMLESFKTSNLKVVMRKLQDGKMWHIIQ